MTSLPSGPLAGVRVLEFAGIGPTPFCGMLLSDLGADVVRIDRPDSTYDRFMVETRGRRSVVLDLKSEGDRQTALAMIEKAHIMLEGLRPGAMERLGLGPSEAMRRNAGLVYGRMTGWGQAGPHAAKAGHDINFIAGTGALHAIGPAEQPMPPLNLVGDYGGGALYLVMGVLAALRHAERTGEGQIIDCAMSDGAASLMASIYGNYARGEWHDLRMANGIDGGAPFYGTYRCADNKFVSFGAFGARFYASMRDALRLDDALFDQQWDRANWARMREAIGEVIATRTRAEWIAHFAGLDACFAPVLSLAEVMDCPHNQARGTFVEVDGVLQPAPAPRFSATPGQIRWPPVQPGNGAKDALADWGVH